MYCTSLGESNLLIKCALLYTTVISSFHTHIHTGLYYEHACNADYQEMCFHEASKLNQGQCEKTFITPSRQGGVATQQSGGAQSMNLANRSAICATKTQSTNNLLPPTRCSQDSQPRQQSTTAIASSEEPMASIFLQTAAYLLDVHALKVYTHSKIVSRVLSIMYMYMHCKMYMYTIYN